MILLLNVYNIKLPFILIGLDFVWIGNGLTLESDPWLSLLFQLEIKLIYSTFQVTPSDPKFYGVYECVAHNIHGIVKHEIKLQQAHAPSEILQAKMDVVTGIYI